MAKIPNGLRIQAHIDGLKELINGIDAINQDEQDLKDDILERLSDLGSDIFDLEGVEV